MFASDEQFNVDKLNLEPFKGNSKSVTDFPSERIFVVDKKGGAGPNYSVF